MQSVGEQRTTGESCNTSGPGIERAALAGYPQDNCIAANPKSINLSGIRSLPVSAASSRECSPRSAVSDAPSLATQAMARLAQSRAGPRTFVPDSTPRKGLTTGDVIVLRTRGAYLAATSVSQIGTNSETSSYTLAPSDITDPHDRALQLEILRQGPWIGLRSSIAGDRLLQARRRGPNKIAFFSSNLGTWEQWEVEQAEKLEQNSWSEVQVRLRNRRMPSCELSVQMIRIGRCLLAPLASVTPRSLPAVAMQDDENLTENINIRHMSGLLVNVGGVRVFFSFAPKGRKTSIWVLPRSFQAFHISPDSRLFATVKHLSLVG